MPDFVDSGIVLHALSGNLKAERAWAVLTPGNVIGKNTLDAVVETYRHQHKLSWPAIKANMNLLRQGLMVVDSTLHDHDLAVELAERYRLVPAHAIAPAQAMLAGCRVVWSEHLPHLLTFHGKVQSRNPFQVPR